MQVVIRADASARTGSGHVMRTLTLARALQGSGASVRFVSQALGGDLDRVIASHGIGVDRLPSDAEGSSARSAQAQEADAAHTRTAIAAAGVPVDWIVVDHYGLDAHWERAMRPVCRRILAIDDLADRAHDCDVLLDQNLVADQEQRYAGKLPDRAVALLGPEYALLQPEYADYHRRATARTGPVRRILVFFGGGDTGTLTVDCVAAFRSLQRGDIALDVVGGASGAPRDRVRRVAAESPEIVLHDHLPTLAPLMAAAQLCVGAGGSTSWERLCLGLPALVVTVADNQRPIAAELARRGLVSWLGHQDAVSEASFATALAAEIERGANEVASRNALDIVDGQGADRVCATMVLMQDSTLRVRPVAAEDEALVLRWANDPETRRNAFSQEHIQPEAHRAWFRARLAARDTCRFFVVETHRAVPVGQVRFDLHDGEWEISYLVAPAFRGRGLGRRVLQTALDAMSSGGDVVVIGRVKKSNTSSQRIFEILGFTLLPELDARGALVYRRDLKDYNAVLPR